MRCLVALALVSALAGRAAADEVPGVSATTAPAQATDPTPATLAPPATAYERRYRTGLLYSGIGVFAGSYLLSLGLTAAIAEEDYKAESMYYVLFPVVGPMGLAASGIAQSGHVLPLLASSAVQATGLVLMFIGTRSRIVPRSPESPRVSLVPSVWSGGGAAHVVVTGF